MAERNPLFQNQNLFNPAPTSIDTLPAFDTMRPMSRPLPPRGYAGEVPDMESAAELRAMRNARRQNPFVAESALGALGLRGGASQPLSSMALEEVDPMGLRDMNVSQRTQFMNDMTARPNVGPLQRFMARIGSMGYENPEAGMDASQRIDFDFDDDYDRLEDFEAPVDNRTAMQQTDDFASTLPGPSGMSMQSKAMSQNPMSLRDVAPAFQTMSGQTAMQQMAPEVQQQGDTFGKRLKDYGGGVLNALFYGTGDDNVYKGTNVQRSFADNFNRTMMGPEESRINQLEANLATPVAKNTNQGKGKNNNQNTFASAFAKARKSGKKVFTYKGRKFTTAIKGEDKPFVGPLRQDFGAAL